MNRPGPECNELTLRRPLWSALRLPISAPPGGVCLNGAKRVQMAFQTSADVQIRAMIGGKGDRAPLALGLWYGSHDVGCHLGNVGLK